MGRSIFKKCAAALVAGAMLMGVSSNARAAWSFDASGLDADGKPVSAHAGFDIVGGKLVVTVQNTSTAPTPSIGSTLYSIYFTGVSGLALDSAVAPAGSRVWDMSGIKNGNTASPPTALVTDMNIAWKLTTAPSGASALGAQVGGPINGLLSDSFEGLVGGGLGNKENHNPFIQNTAVLTFSYTGITDIGGVQFGFGTAGYTVPEPSTVVAGALLLLPFAASTVRFMRKNRKA